MSNTTRTETERNINWDEVEYKIFIICNKFSNIDSRFKDDLAQELRIHAYYYSDDYYDLHRKAIDFWRNLTRKVYPEVPFIDLELMSGYDTKDIDNVYFEDVVRVIKSELTSDVYDKSSDINLNKIALKILDIILEDIEGSKVNPNVTETIRLHKYRNGKINISYLDLRLPDINYKTIAKAFNRLKDVVETLETLGRI